MRSKPGAAVGHVVLSLHSMLCSRRCIRVRPTDIQEAFRTMLHKLVHSDPAGSVYNMFERHDGVPVFSCGKMVDQPQVCNLISIAGRHYLERLVAIAAQIFPAPA
jgi:hypothetical protein